MTIALIITPSGLKLYGPKGRIHLNAEQDVAVEGWLSDHRQSPLANPIRLTRSEMDGILKAAGLF